MSQAPSRVEKRAPCPICGKRAEAEFAPFCSPRCADIDLGRWLGERYALPSPPDEGTEQDENRQNTRHGEAGQG